MPEPDSFDGKKKRAGLSLPERLDLAIRCCRVAVVRLEAAPTVTSSLTMPGQERKSGDSIPWPVRMIRPEMPIGEARPKPCVPHRLGDSVARMIRCAKRPIGALPTRLHTPARHAMAVMSKRFRKRLPPIFTVIQPSLCIRI